MRREKRIYLPPTRGGSAERFFGAKAQKPGPDTRKTCGQCGKKSKRAFQRCPRCSAPLDP